MSKKSREKPKRTAQEAAAPGMGMDAILAQLASLKDNARSFQAGEDPDPIWQRDVEACEAATAILSALQDEGINDAEQARDLIADYNALAAQYQEMHRKYEEGSRPGSSGRTATARSATSASGPIRRTAGSAGRRFSGGGENVSEARICDRCGGLVTAQAAMHIDTKYTFITTHYDLCQKCGRAFEAEFIHRRNPNVPEVKEGGDGQ